MRPLYAAKLEDLGPEDRIKVECDSCEHVGLIAATGLGPPPHTSVLDLKHWLRCQRCGAKGRAVVSVQTRPLLSRRVLGQGLDYEEVGRSANSLLLRRIGQFP
jgi:hypothetical protein